MPAIAIHAPSLASVTSRSNASAVRTRREEQDAVVGERSLPWNPHLRFAQEGERLGRQRACSCLGRRASAEDDDTIASLAARVRREELRLYPDAVRLFAEDRLRIEGNRVRILEARTSSGARQTPGRS